MKQLILTCDRCNVVQQGDSKLSEVAAGILSGSYDTKLDIRQRHYKVEWCESCCKHFGLVYIKKEDKPVEPVTLEDLIREIVRSEMEDK